MNFLFKIIKSFLLRFCLTALVVIYFPATAFCLSTGIIAFGDSLTEGCDVHLGDSVCGWSNGYGYTNELRSLLLTNSGYQDFVVYNYGRGGETTDQGVDRIDSVLDDPCIQEAEFILIMEGTNDLLHHAGWPEVIFNLGVMVDKSRARGIEPLLATLTPDPEHGYKDILLMNEQIRLYAVAHEVILVDLYNATVFDWGVYTNPRGCYGDLIHPNQTGFDVMGTTLYESLSPLLPGPAPLSWLMLLLGTP